MFADSASYMLRMYFRIFILLSSLRFCAYSQDMAHMTLAEASERLEQVYNASAPARDFVTDAIDSKRLDILELCWEKLPIGVIEYHFLNELETLPDSEFRNRMLLLVLKSSNTNQRYADDGLKSHVTEREWFANLLLPMIRKALPDTPLDYDYISTLEKRLVVARAMEKALGIASENPENARRVSPPKPGTKSGARSAPVQGDETETKTTSLAAVAEVTKPNDSAPIAGWPLLAGIAAVLAVIARWLMVRLRDSSRSRM